MCLACGSAWRVDPRVTHNDMVPLEQLVRAQVHPPALAGAVLKVQSFCIGRALAPAVDHSH
jgi:hypothetical protein